MSLKCHFKGNQIVILQGLYGLGKCWKVMEFQIVNFSPGNHGQ